MIENLHSTPIYGDVVSGYNAINSYLDKIIDDVNFNMKSDWGSTHYISTNFDPNTQPNIIDDYNLKEVYKEIDIHLERYCHELNFPIMDYNMQSWLSMFKKGNYGHVHNHVDADISGVYYYKTNGEDGNIFFESANPFLEISKCFMNIAEVWEHKPQVGKILLFPGWLKHGIKTNNTDNIRISLSFNIYFKTN